MTKRTIVILVIFLLTLLCVGATYAVLSSVSRPVENTFTSGKVEISLIESSDQSYKMIPGVTHKKDPRVTVHSGSEASWLFFRIEKTSDFDEYMYYTIADGWTPLDTQSGVYWRSIPYTDSDMSFPLLLDDKVSIKDTVTEDKLASLSKHPYITFYAYAVQSEGISSPAEAWNIISE